MFAHILKILLYTRFSFSRPSCFLDASRRKSFFLHYAILAIRRSFVLTLPRCYSIGDSREGCILSVRRIFIGQGFHLGHGCKVSPRTFLKLLAPPLTPTLMISVSEVEAVARLRWLGIKLYILKGNASWLYGRPILYQEPEESLKPEE